MDYAFAMQSNTYHSPPNLKPPLDRRFTVIEDEPQDTAAYHGWSSQHQKFDRLSTVIESPDSYRGVHPPTAFHFQHDTHHDQHGQHFDDLYDMSDSEVEAIPISISVSLEPSDEPKNSRRRYPSLVIPSPSMWPTPPGHGQTPSKTKGQSPASILSLGLLSPASILSPTPTSLAKLAARNAAARPSSSNAPSLDGSMTSDELSNLSCPSTPDVERPAEPEDWSAPVQLHPEALETLECLTGLPQEPEAQFFAIPVAEMQEIEEIRAHNPVELLITPLGTDDGSITCLSIPSPGGFFSALEPSSRQTWTRSPEEPSTSTAESFYGVPWRSSSVRSTGHAQRKPPSPLSQSVQASRHSGPTVEHDVFVNDEENLTEGPPTARRVPVARTEECVDGPAPGPKAGDPKADWTPDRTEYDEDYIQELHTKSVQSLDRTTHWLQQQTSLASVALEKSQSDVESRQRSLSDLDSVASSDASTIGTSQKSVRFAEPQSDSAKVDAAPSSPKEKDPTFVRGFERLNECVQKSDVFVHRKTRNDALRLDRSCLFSAHIDHLEGKYEMPNPQRVAPLRPISHFPVDEDETSEEKVMMENIQKDHKALEQIKPVSWNLEATKFLNGGGLLMSPTGKSFKHARRGKVLDLGGQATCDWAWQVAIEHPNVTVHTVYTADQQEMSSTALAGPANHKQKMVPNLWTLPYPNSYFHLVSARNLFQHLRTLKPTGRKADEYDLCLAEALRVLKPGGYLEFSLLDADILNPGPLARALGVEFCFNLRARGYDPSPTKYWLPRLRRAGFGDVRRAWLVLPMVQTIDEDHPFVPAEEGEGNTYDASYISGMVGSWAWERWMLKLHREMGKPADRLLEGVQSALEEGARNGASWRYLSGWARKPKD